MTANKMQPETLEENRERLIRMSQAERDGFEATAEGQMIPVSESIADPGGPESEMHEIRDQLRLRPSVQDRADQDAVQQIQSTVVADQVERRAARAENRAPELKSAAQRDRKATRKAPKKSDGE